MTMINFKRAGGILGRETEANIDLNQLPASESQRVQNLINESNFFAIPFVNSLFSTKPDEYEYSITIIAGNTIHTVRASDTAMPHSLRPLIDELTEIAKEAQGT